MQVFTDLAMEAPENAAIKRTERELSGSVKLTSIDKGSEGRYFTFETTSNIISDSEARKTISIGMADALKDILKLKRGGIRVLVIGLGNRGMTADALGPRVADRIKVLEKRGRALCAFTPSVTGLTGLETYDIVKGVTDRIKPDALIAIDTLASRRVSRISSAFQISDRGIRPGSGVGSARKAIDAVTVGIPVVAIGVPLVVYAKTLAGDVLSEYLENADKYDLPAEAVTAIQRSLDFKPSDLVVTPKEIDVIVDAAADIIAGAVNRAFWNRFSA